MACLADYERWETHVASYDTDIGLLACHRVTQALERLPLQRTAAAEYEAIIDLLERLRLREDLARGEYSTEAASIGSILGRFQRIEF